MNTKIENLLDKPEVAKTLKSAAHRAASIARTIRGPEPVTIEMLQSACRAANTVAHTLNKICGEVADRTGRGVEIAALKAEVAFLSAELTEVRAVSIQRRDAINGHHMARGWERQLSGELATAKAQNAELLAALQAAIECGLIPSSSAREGGACAHSRQAQVADQVRDAVTNATRSA